MSEKTDNCQIDEVTCPITTNADESDELFSDDEGGGVQHSSDTLQDAANLKPFNDLEITHSNDIIPSTPISLVPFLSNKNEQWSSDLETPETVKSSAHVKSSQRKTKNKETTSETKQCTPKLLVHQSTDDKIASDSPITDIKEVRKYPKRLTFKSSESIDATTPIKAECTKAQTGTLCATEAVKTKDQSNITNLITTNPSINTISVDYESKESNEIQDMNDKNQKMNEVTLTDTLNVSTQEFFSNASFSNVDEICFNNFEKQATTKTDNLCYNKQCNDNIDNNVVHTSDLQKIKGKGSTCFFNAANGIVSDISEEALLKGQHMMENIKSEVQTDKSFPKEDSTKSKNILIKEKSQFIKLLKNDVNNEVSTNNNTCLILPSRRTTNSDLANTSKEVLFKSKISLQQVSDQGNDIYKNSLNQKNKITSSLFSTASGAPINISMKSLARAQTLVDELTVTVKLDEIALKSVSVDDDALDDNLDDSLTISQDLLEKLDTPMEAVTSDKIDITNNHECNTKVINIVPCATSPNILKQPVKGKDLYHNDQIENTVGKEVCINNEKTSDKIQVGDFPELVISKKDDINENIVHEHNTSTVEFPIACNVPISTSEHMLSNVKESFAEQSNERLLPIIAKKTDFYNKGTRGQRSKILNSELQTSEKTNINDKETKEQELIISKIDCHTACSSIHPSEQALSKEKVLLVESLHHFKEADSPVIMNKVNEEKQSTSKCTPEYTEILFLDNYSEIKSCDEKYTSQSLLQRRRLSSDDSTPLSRSFQTTLESKKKRVSSDFQGRRLFSDSDDSNVDIDKIETDKSNTNTNQILQNDDGACKEKITTCHKSLNEVASSTDEFSTNQDQTAPIHSTLCSPERDTSECFEQNTVSSPVIGKQPISRKRRYLERWLDMTSCTNKKKPKKDESQKMIEPEKETNEKEIDEQISMQVEIENCHTEESNEYGDTQIMMHFINESARTLQDRLKAALDQEKVITAKRGSKLKPSVGHLYKSKQIESNQRLSLKEISDGLPPVPLSYQELIDQGIPPNILTITATTAKSYMFRCSDFYGNDVAQNNVHGIVLGDGARLILDENGYMGVWEFLRAFLASPGVDPNLIPPRWIENHYRWIIWKLASMDRMKFALTKLPRLLTPSNVMQQLKYRYDREIDRSQRSAIRRILEKDDIASNRIVLCVSSIEKMAESVNTENNQYMSQWKIELTDGWYSVPGCIDTGLIKYISNGKLKEGMKLITSGAELLNCDQGCSPLEASPNVCLKLHTNSTRRVRWDTKLGYSLCSGPILVKLCNICPNGGLISKMIVTIARIYPTLYHEKTNSGDSIIRNSKCEEKAQIEYEQQYRSRIEEFYAKAEKEFQEKGCQDDTELSENYERSSRKGLALKKRYTESLQELHLKEEQFKEKLQSKLRESLPLRQVTSLLKIRVCDQDSNAILSIWSPSEEVTDALKEGACISVCNVVASGKKGCEIQLTARRSAIFRPATMSEGSYPLRKYTSFDEVENSNFAPLYGEFDTVGFIYSIGPAPYGLKDFDIAHLAYPKAGTNDSSYLSILFWHGIANYGYTEILTVGSTVACNNLEWRRATSWNITVAYCTDRTTFTQNPRRNHLYEPFESLRSLITDPIVYAENCSQVLNIELQQKPTSRTPMVGTLRKNTPSKIYNSVRNTEKESSKKASPLSTTNSNAANSSRFVAVNPAIQKRLDKLQYYDDPPDLSPITLRNSSRRVSMNFRSPVGASKSSSSKDTNKS